MVGRDPWKNDDITQKHILQNGWHILPALSGLYNAGKGAANIEQARHISKDRES